MLNDGIIDAAFGIGGDALLQLLFLFLFNIIPYDDDIGGVSVSKSVYYIIMCVL